MTLTAWWAVNVTLTDRGRLSVTLTVGGAGLRRRLDGASRPHGRRRASAGPYKSTPYTSDSFPFR